MDLARPSFPHLPGYEFRECAVRRDHRAGPLWPITWTPPPRGQPAAALVASNNKGQVLPIEVLCLEKHGCEVDTLHSQVSGRRLVGLSAPCPIFRDEVRKEIDAR
jgi:hypothetical protein